jgi:hypothetical protein
MAELEPVPAILGIIVPGVWLDSQPPLSLGLRFT